MPRISILSRDQFPVFTEVGQPQFSVLVTYATDAVSPRTVILPVDPYRPASSDELKANPRFKVYPLDDPAIQAERLAIQQDLDLALRGRPETFDTS